MTGTYNPYRLFVGAFVPNWLMERPEISPGAKLCFARLCQYAGRDGRAYPSYETLAASLGVGRRQAIRYAQELERMELIQIVKKPGSANHFRFLKHDWMFDGPKRRGDASVTPDSSLVTDPSPGGATSVTPGVTDPSPKENQVRDSKRGEGGPVGKPDGKTEERDAREAIQTLLATIE